MSIGENAILNSALGISSGKTKSSFPLYFLGSFSHRESGGADRRRGRVTLYNFGVKLRSDIDK